MISPLDRCLILCIRIPLLQNDRLFKLSHISRLLLHNWFNLGKLGEEELFFPHVADVFGVLLFGLEFVRTRCVQSLGAVRLDFDIVVIL